MTLKDKAAAFRGGGPPVFLRTTVERPARVPAPFNRRSAKERLRLFGFPFFRFLESKELNHV